MPIPTGDQVSLTGRLNRRENTQTTSDSITPSMLRSNGKPNGSPTETHVRHQILNGGVARDGALEIHAKSSGTDQEQTIREPPKTINDIDVGGTYF